MQADAAVAQLVEELSAVRFEEGAAEARVAAPNGEGAAAEGDASDSERPEGGEASEEREHGAQSVALGPETTELMDRTIAKFKSKPAMPKLQGAAQRKYDVFCRNRTAELYTTFFALVGVPDLRGAELVLNFTAPVPFPGKKNERPVSGMAKDGSIPHGLVRYEYQGCVIEECRQDGLEHGLRVVCTQMGDIWIRMHNRGKRLAQIVLSSDYSVASNPKPIDEGGLKVLQSHLHLILECFEAKSK